MTYKMYADFYYRDENNIPTIKYDILEDNINNISYFPETNKIQWHPYKSNEEYVHWCNNDTFTNKMNKEKMRDCVWRYTKRWHNYHTLKDYLNSLDLSIANEETVETWAIRHFKCDDTLLIRTM